ncbi:kelch repeat-containing protein [Streptomyces sp. NPDC048290]|uniref:Kelch repeat-containing protein n=1 Tax=Streptomyces sp. NPDC048290 TaxID=3155811 RepID=UPI003430F273
MSLSRRSALGALAGLSITAVAMAAPGGSAQAARSSATKTTVTGAQGQWRARTPMPQARGEVGAAVLDGRLYVVGGTLQQDDSAPVWASDVVTGYDPRTDRWSTHAPLPRPLTHVAMAALGGRLYAIAGFTDAVHLNPQPVAYVYDPAADQWSRLPDLPEKLGSVAVAAVDGRLHVIGGRDSRSVVTIADPPISLGYGTVNSHFVYDPRLRRWSTARRLPGEARDHVGVAVLGCDIHVFGGRVADVTDNLPRHDVYHTRTGRWSTAAPLPVPRSAGAAVVLDGRIVYAGGECGSGGDTFGDVTVYDPASDRWSAGSPLPQSRHGFGAGAVRGRAYFAAGAPTCGGGASKDILELRLS